MHPTRMGWGGVVLRRVGGGEGITWGCDVLTVFRYVSTAAIVGHFFLSTVTWALVKVQMK